MTRNIVLVFIAASLVFIVAGCSSADRSEWCEEQCQTSREPEACYSKCIMGPEHGVAPGARSES